jgi:hypothetical protein
MDLLVWGRLMNFILMTAQRMRLLLYVFFILPLLNPASLAAEIRVGAVMEVKANSIWFEEAIKLDEWQQKRKTADATAFGAYQKELLGQREAWQFIRPLKVRIIGYDRKKNRVYVEMLSKGRFEGLNWFIDDSAFGR